MTVYEDDKEEKEHTEVKLSVYSDMRLCIETYKTIRQVHQGYKIQINCTFIY